MDLGKNISDYRHKVVYNKMPSIRRIPDRVLNSQKTNGKINFAPQERKLYELPSDKERQ